MADLCAEAGRASSAFPLLLLLHGATGSAARITSRTGAFDLARRARRRRAGAGLARGHVGHATGPPGPDLAFIDRAASARARRSTRIASRWADSPTARRPLSLGLTNGDALATSSRSAGIHQARRAVGHPAIFVSHGTRDDILPADDTSRKFVRTSRTPGAKLRYREFNGSHTVPPEVLA